MLVELRVYFRAIAPSYLGRIELRQGVFDMKMGEGVISHNEAVCMCSQLISVFLKNFRKKKK